MEVSRIGRDDIEHEGGEGEEDECSLTAGMSFVTCL
jgi:hypothetical protein